jgi:hypothetical protein
MTTTQTETQPTTERDVLESRAPIFKMIHGGTGRVISIFYNGTVTGLEPDDDWLVVNLIPTFCEEVRR